MKKLFAAALFVALSQSANATFIDNGTYLTDSQTGLDWLDVTSSVYQSYNYVSSQFGSGGLYEGYSYATGAQVNELISNWTGNTIATMNPIIHPEGAIDGLVAALGSTLDSFMFAAYGLTYDQFLGVNEGEGFDYTYGMIADVTGLGTRFASLISDDDTTANSFDVSIAYFTGETITDSSVYPMVGSYLVRNTIPEPASLALVGLGLLSLGLFRRSRRIEKNSPLGHAI